MKEKQEDRIETISILNRTSGLGIEVLFCNISHKAFFSVNAVNYAEKKKNRITASTRLTEPVSFHDSYCTYSGEFTATLVKHPPKYHLVFSAPALEYATGESGVKGELALPTFESNTFSREKDGCTLTSVSPMPVEGMLFLNHRSVPLSRDNAMGFLCSLSGDFRDKEISMVFSSLTDTGGELWGYVGSKDRGLCMRNSKNFNAELQQEPLFSVQEKLTKGYIKSEYLRLSGSFDAGEDGIREIQSGYAIRTSFLI